MFFDPEDDECQDSFELERYITVSVAKVNENEVSLRYIEFDRRLIAHQEFERQIQNRNAILCSIIRNVPFKDAPFFARYYLIHVNLTLRDKIVRHHSMTHYCNSDTIVDFGSE